jgi:putative mRNA 3-end processing factor
VAISLGEYRVALDSKDDEANVNFVSHAHSDHTSGLRKNKKVIASAITKELIECRSGKSFDLLEELDCLDLLNAGHILGSKQLYVENKLYGYSMVYSGDYQIDEPIIAEKIETRQADVVVLDSTYPSPEIKFDDKNEVVTSIQHYAKMKLEKGVVLFGAHVVGRSQELVKILNEIGITPVVGEKVANATAIYNKYGFDLKYSTEPMDAVSGNFVGIIEQSKLRVMKETIASKSSKRVFTAVASGLARMFRFDTDVQFALSDHADFSQAVDYLNACSPKIVFTLGRNSTLFAKNLALKGYDARPLQHASHMNNFMLNYV